MAAIVRMLPFAVLILGPLGCAGPGAQSFAGSWRGTADFQGLPSPITDLHLLNTLRAIKLNIEPGGEFNLVQFGLPVAGRIERSGGKVYLAVETVLDRKAAVKEPPGIDSQRRIEIRSHQPDGQPTDPPSIVLNDPALPGKPLILQLSRNP